MTEQKTTNIVGRKPPPNNPPARMIEVYKILLHIRDPPKHVLNKIHPLKSAPEIIEKLVFRVSPAV